MTIFLSPADDQETSVKLLGQVTVDALADCVHELTVQNLAISGPDGKVMQYGVSCTDIVFLHESFLV